MHPFLPHRRVLFHPAQRPLNIPRSILSRSISKFAFGLVAASLGFTPARAQDFSADGLTELDLESVVDRLEDEIEETPSTAETPRFQAQPGDSERYANLFYPFETENAALSPDGQKIAYSRRIDEDLWVTIVAVDDPGTPLAQVVVVTDEGATPALRQQGVERVPGRIEWMGWVTADRLVMQTNQVFMSHDGNRFRAQTGGIIAMNSDGSEAEHIAEPKDFGHGGGVIIDPFLADESMLGADARSVDASAAASEREAAGNDAVPAIVLPNLKIVDYNPERPDEVWVRAGPVESFNLYSVNVFTGKKRLLRTERVVSGRTPLLNRQQQAEVAVMNTTLTKFPHHYLQERIFPRWQKINNLVDDPKRVNFTLGPENVQADRSYPLGFDEDSDILYFASDVGKERFGIYGLNRSTGELTGLAIEHPSLDLAPPQLHDFTGQNYLIYDRFSRAFLGIRLDATHRTAVWLHPNWQALQAHLEDQFPGMSVDILEWDESYQRSLVRVYGPTDPGAYLIFDLPTNRLIEFARVAPHLDERNDAWTIDFPYEAPTGRSSMARLTVPSDPIVQPAPLIVFCRENFWDRLPVDFDREAMALARMGYVVAQFNGPGAWGFGRETRTAIRDGYEMAQAEEIVALVEVIKKGFDINPEKVALMGEGLGGFLALRTLQEFPEHFRCAMAIDAPFNLRRWIESARWSGDKARASDLQLVVPYLGDEEHLRSAPLVDAPERILRPVQLFAFRREDGDRNSPDYNNAFTLARVLRRNGLAADLIDLHVDYARGLPNARAGVFAEIAAFLDTHLFRYDVDLGELEYDMGENVK